MTKTVDLQIEKSKTFINGLRRNSGELKSKGIHISDLDKMDAELAALKAASEDCDAERERLKTKVKNLNALLGQVKESFTANKNTGQRPASSW